MVRAKKLWRPLRVWRSHEWVSFKKAWQRAEKVILSDLLWLMQRDLCQEFLDGRLIMAVRFFAPDGTETMRTLLEPGVLAVAPNQLRVVDNRLGNDTRVGSGCAQ